MKNNSYRTAGEASPAQQKAIAHVSGAMQVIAGPGSGKTYLIIRRIHHLIRYHGISPDHILVITFTKAAAMEMKERFSVLTKNSYPSVAFGTFHAVYYQILKSSGKMRDHLLLSAKDKKAYMKHCLSMCGIEDDVDEDTFDKLFREISRVKNSSGSGTRQDISAGLYTEAIMEWEENPVKKHFPYIYNEYNRIMRENHKLDFDDMIILCDRVLSTDQELLFDWQKRFSHILVDEFQDISPLQYKVLQNLAAPENNLFIVGDDDQSIYGFRGTGPEIMKQFMQDYPAAQQIILNKNYRCREAIVQASLLLIEDNHERFAKSLQAEKKGGDPVKIHLFSSREEEENYIVEELKKIEPENLEKTAVISRTNAQAAGLSKILFRHGIPFHIQGKTGCLMEHPIAKDILAYLRFAEQSAMHPILRTASGFMHPQQGTGTRRDFLRIMNKPCRYIHREALPDRTVTEADLLGYYQEKPYMQQKIRKLFADLQKISMLRPYLAADYIRKNMGYDSYLYGKREGSETWLEIADDIQETLRNFSSPDEWIRSISSYRDRDAAADTEQKSNAKDSSGNPNGVHLITMHGSKGLEYDQVFIPDVNEKVIPHKKAVSLQQIEEERRLLYVAVTRAKERLEILCSGRPSRFLDKLRSQDIL